MISLSQKNLPIPQQQTGIEKNIEEQIQLPGIAEAKAFFTAAKTRLLSVNEWDKLCGDASAKFQLTDEKGIPADGSPKIGNYFKIKIPGPGTVAGSGYDWVQVEEIIEKAEAEIEFIIIRVRPASDPTSPDESTAHFYSSEATSNFLVLREGAEVVAAVLGRNEEANTNEGHGLLDKIRNFVVGTGAKIGLSDLQWKGLVKGVLGRDA